MGINNPLSAIGYRLAAFGSRLPASGFRQLTADSGKLIKEYTYNESSYNRSDRAAWL